MADEVGLSARKVRRLVDLLGGKKSLLILMQDNPDPDSIAGAAALRRIANAIGEVPCSIAYGGAVGRGENRAMMRYLRLNFRHMREVEAGRFAAIALVDTQPGTGNNSLPEHALPDIVVDHHPLRTATRKVAFTDVRSRYGAVSTILFEYLSDLGITPDATLATALLYGIRSDTQDLGREAIAADRRAAHALFPLANTAMLSAIQRGSVRASYFRNLARALGNARVYGPAIATYLDEVDNPDILGETADLLLRHEGIDWILCQGVYEGTMWLSLRTAQTAVRAVDVAHRIVDGIGTGGGHEMSAGGQVPLGNDGPEARDRARRTVQKRFLEAVGANPRAGRGLVST
jgi:nanoRNase/pAp phosphatase (c-di-AMP/oligoRNAs hydrolase)